MSDVQTTATASRENVDPTAAANDAVKPASRSGAAAVLEAMQASGIELLVGYSGGGTGALIHEVAVSGMHNLNARTELSAAWISYGYNHVRRRAASACLFHCVGLLHAAPAIYAATLDSVPLFVMDIGLDSSLDLRDALQDSTANYIAVHPLGKYVRKVVVPDDLPLAVRQAVLSASTGRPGAAVLDLPYQVLVKPTETPAERLEMPAPPGAGIDAIDKTIDMLVAAENPVLLVGAGTQMSGAQSELVEFAELLGIPVTSTSWGGRGAIADDHPLFAGVVGSFGWVSANDVVQRSDCWLALGTTFSQITTGAWNIEKPSTVIQVDIDPLQLGKIFQPTLGVIGDIRVVLRQLIDRVKERQLARPATAELLALLADSRADWAVRNAELASEVSTPINQYHLIKKISDAFAGAIVVADSGGHAFMMYRSFQYRTETPMVAGGRYMSLGAALPMAIGAKLAAPERTVICYHGDGGFYYDFAELSTLSSQNIKVIVIVDNNGCLLANRQGMRLRGIENPWVDLPDTDFVGLAKAMGVDGERVTAPADIDAALERARQASGSYLIDVVTDPETRIKRGIKNVIPILTDRAPRQDASAHFAPPLEGSWPA